MLGIDNKWTTRRDRNMIIFRNPECQGGVQSTFHMLQVADDIYIYVSSIFKHITLSIKSIWSPLILPVSSGVKPHSNKRLS